MSTYDPSTRTIHHARKGRGGSAYTRFHEQAHAEQHRQMTPAWCAHAVFQHVPYLCRLARLWIEWEAARMALRRIKATGGPWLAAKTEARRELRGYARAVFCG